MIPAASRKPHRKSRNGCGHCKRRKIKCDETKPHCRNCIKHSIPCDFPDILARKASASASSQSPQRYLGSAAAQASTAPTSNPSPSSAASPHPHATALLEGEGHMQMNMVDLELLHNFVTSTAFTISQNADLRTLWRVEVPRLAFQHDFVMRAILAVSAAHMAHWKPDRADFYMARAVAHHKIGLRGPTSILPHVTEDNCSALYIFSALTAILSLAMPRKPEDILFVSSDGVAEWLFLLRGIASIVFSSADWLLNGVIGPMLHRVKVPAFDPAVLVRAGLDPDDFKAEPLPTDDPVRPPEHDQLADLRRFLERDLARDDPHACQVCCIALDELVRSYTYICNLGPSDCHLRSIFSWPCAVSNDYLAALTAHEPHALLVFAYYSVLLHRLDGFWWIKGWGTHLISRIYHLIAPIYRQWVRWPIEEIGWVPR
ncbi:c6 zinc finger protein [Diplodia corticola]|uniref:C6 zinc finger protein n=1 Tax=Diplodia corticola TaxID=236234 RepID=A0A1J9QVZ1_9PEZI|nr:c6 zinc finger protein [Diplodia corticola]OJD33158.1 c6 zinc finger protein [Diplodia corticola]